MHKAVESLSSKVRSRTRVGTLTPALPLAPALACLYLSHPQPVLDGMCFVPLADVQIGSLFAHRGEECWTLHDWDAVHSEWGRVDADEFVQALQLGADCHAELEDTLRLCLE